jgi:hypothetical protein
MRDAGQSLSPLFADKDAASLEEPAPDLIGGMAGTISPAALEARRKSAVHFTGDGLRMCRTTMGLRGEVTRRSLLRERLALP